MSPPPLRIIRNEVHPPTPRSHSRNAATKTQSNRIDLKQSIYAGEIKRLVAS